MSLQLRTISLRDANAYVTACHRHHQPVQGHKFSLAAYQGEELVGIAIIGRPVARRLDDGGTLEVTRLCTDGTRNACSFLYGAALRACRALGYRKIITYTLLEEPGVSLRAAGWHFDGICGGGSWSQPSRPRTNKAPTTKKQRWSAS